jgi:predicted transcriptional regulator
MTPENTPKIDPEELDWVEAVVHEGRQPGAVVSVRLDADEAARLRRLAEALGLNVSQVLRRALADYQPDTERGARDPVLLSAFTYGGTALPHEPIWHWVHSAQLRLMAGDDAGAGGPLPTATEPVHIEQRVKL